MGGPMVLEKDFREFLELLGKHGVRYLLVGGYAVVAHGYPRYTKDLDIWIDPTADNARSLIAALEEFGMASLGLSAGDFLQPGTFVQIGYSPVRIDLLTSAPGLTFAEAFEAKEDRLIDGVQVCLIGLPDLLKNKQAAGRTQDLLDYEKLSET